jgi:RNA polymerase sigma-70 factor, ECF subfamily
VAEELTVKQAPAIGWESVGSREAVLVQRCVAGDEMACAELMNEHRRMVFQLALHLLGDHEEALDLTQEVFLRVFRTLHQFRGHAALRTWIYRIVVNQVRNRQRWWKRRHRSDQLSLDDQNQHYAEVLSTGDTVSPDRLLGQKELAATIWRALDALPFDQRTAVVLREIDGLSYEEIAFSLGVAIGTVKSRLTRAREALRAQLKGLLGR